MFPDRNSLVPWEELDERVRSELDVVQEKIFSVLSGDELLLANHHRVIGDFNRGVRSGFLADADQEASMPSRGGLSHSPYQWGELLGSRAKRRGPEDAELMKQFITVTHLLAYEFRQLDFAYTKPFEFLMRNIGPDRADEFGELVFAIPILLNYRRKLTADLIENPAFSFAEYHASQSPAPSHLEYLSQGIVALFDPAPKSWTRVAANLGLATLPFNDGTTLQTEHFQAPDQAATVAARKPIAAQMIVRRQMDRIKLARRWIGSNVATIEMEEKERAPVTLWEVYQSTQAAVIRGHDSYFADTVADNIVRLLSERVEAALQPEDTRLAYLRRHLPAFTRGFDARSERVVDVRAITSAGFGRSLSDGLRRFEQGGIYIAGISQALAELGAALNTLHHAYENPMAFVRAELASNTETEVAGRLLELFDAHPRLAPELFGENAQYEFFSRTLIQTRSPFDLMRSVLFHVVQAMQPTEHQQDTVAALLANAKTTLRRLVELGDTPVHARQTKEASGATFRAAVAHSTGRDSDENPIIVMARLLEPEFETLKRVCHQLVYPLYVARTLSKPQQTFMPDYLARLGQRGVS